MNEYVEHGRATDAFEHKSPAAFCGQCGVPLSEGQRFCHRCGSAVEVASVVPRVPAAGERSASQRPYQKGKAFVLSIVKSSLLLAMAIFMVVAAFLPMTTVRYSFTEDVKVSIPFGAVDSLVAFGSALYSVDSAELSELYAALEEDYEEEQRDWLDGFERDSLIRYLKRSSYILYRSEEVDVTLGMVFRVLLSLAQIVLALLLLNFAAYSFASVFTKKVKGNPALVVVLLGVTSIVLLINAYMGVQSAQTTVAAAPICAIIFTCLILLSFAILRVTVEKEKIKVSTIVKHAIGAVLAIALLLSVTAPFVTTQVKGTFREASTAKRETSVLDANLFGSLELSRAAREKMEELYDQGHFKAAAQEAFSLFGNYTKREFAKGEAETANKLVLSQLLLGQGAYNVSFLFALGGLAVAILFACALLQLWQHLQELATGRAMRKGFSLSVKIVALVMAALVLALLISILIVVNHNADEADISYQAALSYGPILAVIFAVAAVCMPSAEPNPTKICIPFAEEENWKNEEYTEM